MRKWFAVLVALAVGMLVAVPVTVLAVTGGFQGALDRQVAVFRSDPVSTSSPEWTDIPGLRTPTICAIDEVSATVSISVNGAPVSIRVQQDSGPLLQPVVAYFDPGSGTTSFSYTFVGNGAEFERNDNHVFSAQWRSSTGGVVTLNRGDMNVLFDRGPAPGNTCPS
jgi:hypothetical protein